MGSAIAFTTMGVLFVTQWVDYLFSRLAQSFNGTTIMQTSQGRAVLASQTTNAAPVLVTGL